MDPYVVTRLIAETVCSSFESGARTNGAAPTAAVAMRNGKSPRAKTAAGKK